MSHDDTGGFSLTNSEESASSGEVGGSGWTGANSPTMTGNDLGGRSLVQARVQAVVQGAATPIPRIFLRTHWTGGLVSGIIAPRKAIQGLGAEAGVGETCPLAAFASAAAAASRRTWLRFTHAPKAPMTRPAITRNRDAA